jgi:hypothetical protein
VWELAEAVVKAAMAVRALQRLPRMQRIALWLSTRALLEPAELVALVELTPDLPAMGILVRPAHLGLMAWPPVESVEEL